MVAERAVCSVKCSVVSAWSSCCWCSASGRARLEAERAADADALASGAPGRLGAVMTSPQVAVGCVELGRAGEDGILPSLLGDDRAPCPEDHPDRPECPP